jgi:hypothetical protein
MAVLSEQDRRDIWAEFMRRVSSSNTPIGLDKSELRAAVDYVDDWINDNAASFLDGFPEPAKSALSNKEKAGMFFDVADKRWRAI